MVPNNTIHVEDYINRPELKAHIRSAIKAYYEHRQGIIIPEGCKLKRTEEDYLEERSLFNPEELLNQYKLIMDKKSTLPSNIRKKIQGYVFEGIILLVKADAEANKSKENGNEEESRG